MYKLSIQVENLRTGIKGRGGKTTHVSYFLLFYCFGPVMYLDPVSTFPETTERPGYVVELVDNVGDALTFKILKNDLVTVFYRRVMRSTADASHHHNKRISFKSDVQESLKSLDTKPSFFGKLFTISVILKSLVRSKVDSMYQHVDSRTRSKLHDVNNVSFQNFLSSLHVMICFKYMKRLEKIFEIRSIGLKGL
jgi:hypothetical protein